MDPNQWNTYNIQYGHPTSGGLPSLNRLDLTSAGLSHSLQAGRGVASLQAVNYQALSGLPILDTIAPLTSGLSAQSHQLVFDPQINRISAEPQVSTPTQPLTSPHHYESPGVVSSKSASSRATSESLGRNQLIEAARMWSTPASSFTSPTSLYNQFNAALFPQSVDVSPVSSSAAAPPGHMSISSAAKSSHNQALQQSHPYLQDPPPAHSSNLSATSRLLPVVQRPPDHSLQGAASDSLYSIGRSTSSIAESMSQATRPQYTTHKAVVLGVGNSGLAQLHQDLQRQTPVQHHQHHQQQHNTYQAHRRGDIEDLSSSNIHSNIYASYANLSSESPNYTSNAQQHQHLSSEDINYEAVSPAPPLQQQHHHHLHHQQAESNISAHHPSLSFSLGQFSELANLNPEQAHAFADKYQENDIRLQMGSQMQGGHAQQQSTALSSPSLLQRQQGSTGPSSKISPQQQSRQKSAAGGNRHQAGVAATSQILGHVPPADSRIPTPHTQHQSLIASSGSLLNPPSAPSPIQALADSTTKPKRSRSRKKKGEVAALPVITPANAGNTYSIALSQMHQTQQHQSVAPPSSRDMNLGKKSDLPPSHVQQPTQQQQHLSQPVLGMTSPSPNISTLSMTLSSNSQQANYARAHTPSAPQNFSMSEQQHQAFQSNSSISKTPTSHTKTASSYKQQQKKSPAKSKNNAIVLGGQQPQQSQAFSQNVTNLSQQRGSSTQDGQGRMSSYNAEQQQQKLENQIHSSHGMNTDGHYSKFMGQDQLLVTSGVGYDNLQQPDHLLDEDENRVQQHYQMDFGSQPFMEQLASVPAPPSTSSYGGEVLLTNLVSHEENVRLQQQAGAGIGANARSTYHGASIDTMGDPNGQPPNQMGVEDVSFGAMFPADDSVSGHGSLQDELPPAPEPEMTLTFVPHVVEDEELGHFTNPELSPPVTMLPKQKQNQPRALTASATSSPANDSFQNSFLSYLQGHKQETLSSVSSTAVTKKPQLPKYIPEPRRPKPPPPPPSTNKSATSRFSSQTSQNVDDKQGRETISTFSDSSSQKSESDKEGYSVQRTSDLAVKITLPKGKTKSRFGPFADSTLLKDSMRKNRERKRKKVKFSVGHEEDFMGDEFSDEESGPVQRKQPAPKEMAPTPTRASIGRKAKDKCIEMTEKNRDRSDSEDSFDEVPKRFRPKAKGFDSDDSIYNSDEDPAWMPFDVDLNQGDVVEKRKRPRRQKLRMPTASKVPKQGGVRAQNQPYGGEKASASPGSSLAKRLQTGTFMIEKKDMQNLENYPIWRLEENNLMKKFEAKTVDGNVKHVVSGTVSTWMPSMESQFQTIKVRETEVKENGSVIAVEVLEEYRPKAQMETQLEVQYEDDPLVDPFNVYLQVFLSQALEPNFLAVIKETKEMFYLDALHEIDGMIEKKCGEITKLARWKLAFQEALHRHPLMKEIDRPNLKQPCQASENPSPPSIKSVFLSGFPYDRFLLTDKSAPGTSNQQEFMIGKVAAHYVRTYHSLYHFKYWLRQRCDAKVKMTKESSKAENLTDEIILDKCLENRNWVLQLFDNLKNLLRSGRDVPS